jgi:hypothetical protein
MQPSIFLARSMALALMCSTPFWLGSCQHQPSVTHQKPVFHLPKVLTPPIMHLPNDAALPPMETHQHGMTTIQREPDESYIQWLAQHNQRSIERYRIFLTRQHIRYLPPMGQLLTSARDWAACGREQYNLPPEENWSMMVPTLRVLDRLQEQGILNNFELTSVYRDSELNTCAGGSGGSKHVLNAALDIRLLGEQAEPMGQAEVHARLCRFWQRQGEALNMGMGLYPSGQIHIDTQGYRTWGRDHSAATAFCAK